METEIQTLIREFSEGVEGAWAKVVAYFDHKPDATSAQVIATAATHPEVTPELHAKLVAAVDGSL